MPDPFVHRLEQLVGRAHVLSGDDARGHLTDWTGRWTGSALGVVRPGSTAEVAEVVRACAEAGIAVVPQGGNTGLVGGAVPDGRSVVVSTTRMDAVGPVDEPFGRVMVEAGATLASVQAAADTAGWSFGVDLASRDSATIGGMVATDAGGARTVAHGSMRAQVAGLEVVLGDGTVLQPWLHGLPRHVDCHDVRAALVGSEGTLGIITRVLLQLVRPTPTLVTLLLQSSSDGLAALIGAVRKAVAKQGGTLGACEFMTRAGVARVAEVRGEVSPVTEEVALLVDVAGGVDLGLVEALAALGDGETVVGFDERARRRLWDLREGHTEAIAALGQPVKLDVRVPVDRLGSFLDAAASTVASVVPSATTVLFGHAAEGNVHVNVVGADAHAGAVEDAVYGLVAATDGSVVAEHGIGRAKLGHLHHTMTDEELETMRKAKAAFDPDGVCNPGVRIPVEPR